MKYHLKMQLNAVAVHVLAIAGLYFYWDPLFLLAFFIGHRFIMGIGHDIGLHRYFSHKSFKTKPVYEYLFLFCAWFNIQGSTISWVLRHRFHHAYSDKEGDPHPASETLRTWLWFGNPKIESKLSPMIVKDLLKSKLHMFMHNNYFLGYYVMLSAFTLLFGFKFVLYFFILNGVMGFHTAGLINVLCHKFGYRNFETTDTSKNLTWVNYIHMGAGLHNNHHAYPNSYTNKFKENEFDPSAWMIKNIFATNKSELKGFD